MFREILKDVVGEVDGARAALLMDVDGIAVDQYETAQHHGEIDIEALGIEFSAVLKSLGRAAQSLGLGSTQEITVRYRALDVIVRLLNDEYFLIIATSGTAPTGKARYIARSHAHRLVAEL